MNDVITEYQRWKQQGEELRTQARQAIETRFRELLSEAVRLSEEYRADFGSALKPPVPVTAFRYKAGKAKAKKLAKAKPEAKKEPKNEKPAPPPPPAKPNPKVAGLQKRLATAKKKLEDAKTAGTPTRAIEDRIYEIEDELRLASQA